MDAEKDAQLDAATSYLRRNSASVPTDDVIKDGTLTMRVRRDGAQEHLIDRIAVHGEIDLSNADAFARAMREALESDVAEVIVDLRGLTFIDSTGLRELLIAARISDMDSDRLRVIRPEADEVMRMLTMTGIDLSLHFLD